MGQPAVSTLPALDPAGRPPIRLVVLLGAMIAVAPMSIDMYLPSLPTLERAFAADVASVQMTLAAFFVGLALGQLVYGPLSDRLGRKPPLCAGLILYVLASAGCALAPNIGSLIGLRFVQALGGCAGMVISRAVVRDLFDPRAAARVYSYLILVMGAAPILAPLAGGYLLAAAGWRAIFGVLVAFGLAVLAAAVLLLPETRPRHAPASSPWRDYAGLLADRPFMGYALSGGIAQAGMFAYIAGSPHVFIELYGVPVRAYGWLFGLNALGIISASQVNRRLLLRWRPDEILARANVVNAGLGLLLVAASWSRPGHLLWLLVPLFGFVASLGFTQPNALASALAGQGARAGTASALYGMIQFGTATVAATLVGALHDDTARPMAAIIATCSLLALVAHHVLVRRASASGGSGRSCS
jgi:DHA1 family bicyclomycin/chloramphenicol resistance-like MFS transporter